MKIINEIKLDRGSIAEKLEEIGRKIVQYSPNINNQIGGFIICTKGDIAGMVLFESGEKEKAVITKLKYPNNTITINFKIKDKKDKNWRLWKDYLEAREFRRFNHSKVRFNSVSSPSLVVKKESNSQGVGLEIGFYLVHKKIIEFPQILELFNRYIKKEFPEIYKKIEGTEQSLDIIPKIIDNWITPKHHLGFKYHIGIYLQNIIREERLRKTFSETYIEEKRLKNHLYYLNRVGKISLPKKAGRYQFSPTLLEKTKKDIEKRKKEEEVAKIYAELRKIPYKSAKRWIQLQKRKRLSLEEIAKRIFFKRKREIM